MVIHFDFVLSELLLVMIKSPQDRFNFGHHFANGPEVKFTIGNVLSDNLHIYYESIQPGRQFNQNKSTLAKVTELP